MVGWIRGSAGLLVSVVVAAGLGGCGQAPESVARTTWQSPARSSADGPAGFGAPLGPLGEGAAAASSGPGTHGAPRPAPADRTPEGFPTPTPIEKPAAAGRVGQAVRDRNFDLTVTAVRCGATVPDATPAGQFCLVELGLRNATQRPIRLSLPVFLQQAYGPGGERYAVSNRLSERASKDRNPFLTLVQPGARTDAVLVFDIPRDARIARLHLREGLLTPGVEITV